MKPIDEGMAPVRAVRHAISQEFGNDPHRYAAHLKTLEQRYSKQIEAYKRLGRSTGSSSPRSAA